MLVASVLLTASPASGQQCGIHFQSDYRAVDKLRRFTQNGGTFRLQDWTGDGRSDFWNFRVNQTTQTSDIIIYPALATGYWDWVNPITYTTTLETSASTDPGCCFSYQFRDFNSDGKLDMLLKSFGYPDHKIHLNMGNGTLVPLATIVSPADSNHWMRYIGYADVNSDGRLDWIYTFEVIATGHETFYYSPLNADGSLGSPVPILAHTAENGVNDSFRELGDFDGDGDDDIAYKSFIAGSHQIRILRSMGNGTFTLGTPLATNSLYIFGTADLNNDGRMDIYADSGNSLLVFSGQSDATFTSATYPFTITNPTAYVRHPVDFNGDGRLDVINVDYTDYEIFISNPAGGFFPSQYYPIKLNHPHSSGHFEDFNADGKADLYDRQHEIFNTFGEEVVVIKSNVCDLKGQTRGMDFDSIPLPDIVSWNGATGHWRSGNGDWNSTGSVPIQAFNWGNASLGDIPAPGDFDGDGRTDYAVYRNGEGKWYIDLSSTTAWTEYSFGLPGDIPIPNDYNGGGKTDLAVFRPSDGNWYIFYFETHQFAAVNWGTIGDRPVPADYDGDGKTDIAVFRPSTGAWYYIRSSDLGIVTAYWGINDDVVLPADYDGDGKADLAVFRAGIWHIMRSSNGMYAPVYWGLASDFPLPFLDKGEVSIPTVYRPSNSRWYSKRHGIGFALLLSGGTPVYFGLPN